MSLTAQSSYQCDCHFRMQADGCEDIVFIGGMLVLTFFQRPSHSLRRCTVTASTRATSRTAAPVSLAVHDLPRRSTRSTVPTMQHSVPAQTMPVLNAQGKPTQHRADPRPATRSRKPAALRDGNGRTLPTAHVSLRWAWQAGGVLVYVWWIETQSQLGSSKVPPLQDRSLNGHKSRVLD